MKKFRIRKYGEALMLFIDDVGTNGATCQTVVLSLDEFSELMRTIQGILPMGVCESSDIKFLNGRLRKVEEQLVSVNIKYDKVRDALSDLVGRL
jgi:hypothetical protein